MYIIKFTMNIFSRRKISSLLNSIRYFRKIQYQFCVNLVENKAEKNIYQPNF